MSQQASTDPAPHEHYVKRLRARLARPDISVEEARDGMLDCFVSTYFEGVKSGLKGIVGIDAAPDAVARTAASMFKQRLLKHGSSFETPSVDALAKVKEEVDEEMHFEELPAEIQATHDQVCSLLMSKAEGGLAHSGDRSAVKGSAAATQSAAPAPPEPPTTTDSGPNTRAPTSDVSRSLRRALGDHLAEVQKAVLAGATVADVEQRLAKASRLLETVRDFESA